MTELPAGSGLVLDLDDTLYSERSFHESGFRWLARRFGADPGGYEVRLACEALRRPAGRPLDVLSDAWSVGVDELLTLHRGHPPDIRLYPDAQRLLDRAGSAGVPMVLLTDGRSIMQRNKIEALGVDGLFAAILISEETGVDKYDRRAFTEAARALAGCSPIVSVGDNPAKDIAHPLSLGWTVLLLAERGDNVHPQDSATLAGRSGFLLRDLDAVVLQDPVPGHPEPPNSVHR